MENAFRTWRTGNQLQRDNSVAAADRPRTLRNPL